MNDAPPRARAAALPALVRRAKTDDVATLVKLLAAAFDQDPFYNWILPQDGRRARSFHHIFELILRRMSDELAETFTTEDLGGCAIWKRPGTHKLSLFRQAAETERVTVELARGLLDYLNKARNDPSLRFET